MKRLIIPFILMLFCTSITAQKGKMHERIKAQKVAYITEQLNLTSDEAEKFWPIYNAFDEKMHEYRRKEMRELRERMRNENISESEAIKLIDDYLTLEGKEHKAEVQMFKDLRKILPAKKIVKLKTAEDSFNRILMDRLKQRRQKSGTRKNIP